MTRLPTLKKARVWHMGKLHAPRQRSGFSLEGSTLSVSENPRAWEMILGHRGPTYMLMRKDGKPGVFVDRKAIPEPTVRELLARSGLVTPLTVYVLQEIERDLDDSEMLVERSYARKEDADREFYSSRSRRRVVVRAGWEATPELLRRWRATFSDPLVGIGEFALTETIEALGGYDGIWWNDPLRPSGFQIFKTAPRGGIFQSRLSEWAYVDSSDPTYVSAKETWQTRGDDAPPPIEDADGEDWEDAEEGWGDEEDEDEDW